MSGFESDSECDETLMLDPDNFERRRPKLAVVRPAWERIYTIVVMMIATACLFADQNLLAPNLSEAAQEFGFDEQERDWKLGGELAVAFFLAGAPAALIIGYLTDRVKDRRVLFSGIIVLAESQVLFTYFITHYWQLFLTRMITGISVGGAMPLVFSLLGDLYPISKRAIVAGLYGVAAGLGAGFGQFIAGTIGGLGYGWKLPFVIVAVPAIIVALIVFFTIPEPARGRREEVSFQGNPSESLDTKTQLREILSTKTNIISFLQGFPGCIPWGVVIAFLNDFLAQDKGLSVFTATTLVSCYGIGGITGNILGGLLGQKLYNIRHRNIAILMGATTAIGTFPLLLLINIDYQSTPLYQAYILALLGGCIASFTGPNIRTVVLNVNTPQRRGMAFSIFSICDDLGKGLGPLFASALILSLGRVKAFNLAVWSWMICGALLLSIGLTLESDEQKMVRKLGILSQEDIQAEFTELVRIDDKLDD